ncbi:ATP phosphoribosyltransferase regulatory subunit [Persephonella hydrogeniphila]|uniref:ATP phosphoribosyltransferase regulatory subunit n=1 Tax=Persephonella hydrogeniphila TaxID=198703 RepID=A0A285NRV2_9AQUI|nr:ATP phosphoribosyltransferase regulatory subunit [Persephonella hydrogeniphila]SNZ10566.1 ATP phosphoribosyltransferase regulatory subunit [Persephonella hydrogeniphila]
MNIDIPAGVRTFSRAETFQIKTILRKITDTFEKWAYEEIKLPYFEYLDVHKKGLDEEIIGKSFKIVDRNTGDILCLRADFTAQIARYFSSLKKKNLPKRYYYTGSIFRYVQPKGENLWERLQTGIELIGSSRLEADAEVIAVASQSLMEIGIDNFQIDINNTKIFNILREYLKISDKEYREFMGFIKRREIFNLKRFISDKKVEKDILDFIVNIPKFQGGIELIKDLSSKYPFIRDALTELEGIYSILQDYGLSKKVVFDIGEPKEFSYYTGIVFEIFVKEFPKPIGQGGRYDSLISKYNGNVPATGFAFDILNIWDYMKEKALITQQNYKDYFIIDLTPDKKNAYRIGKILREKGYKVGRDIIDRPLKESIKFAFENRYRKVIVIGLDSNEKEIYIYSTEEEFERKNINEFLEKIAPKSAKYT